MKKTTQTLTHIFDIVSVVLLAIGFVSPLFVADDFHDSTRMGSIFFGIQWLEILIPVGLISLWRGRRIAVSRLTYFMAAWIGWIVLRGKTGGIWHDDKFIWFAGCFALFFITDALLKYLKSIGKEKLVLVVVSTIVAVAAIEAVMGVLQIYGGYRIFHGQFKVTGTFFNPAPYAIFLVASLPWALYLSALSKSNTWGKIAYWGGYATACFILVIVPSTQSRAAYIAAFMCVLIWVFYRYKPLLYIKTILNTPLKRKLTYSLVPIVLIGVAVAMFMFKKDSASGRLLIWKMALRSAQEQIITGNGFNTLRATMAETQANYFASGEGTAQEEILAGSVPWAFNEPLQMLSETGVVGLGFMLLVFGYALFYPLKTRDRQERLKVAAAKGSVASILVFSLFSYPFYFFPVMMLLFMSFAVLAASEIRENNSVRLLPTITIKAVLTVGCLALMIFYIQTLPKQIKGYWTWDEAEKLYQIKEYKGASESYEEVLEFMQYNGLFMQQYGKCLAMEEKYSKSIDVLHKSGKYYKDEFWYIVLGDSYKAEEDYVNAEKYYKKASFVVPHKFYPLYLLAKMYNESGQTQKAKEQANIILNKDIKVESTAIKEIKQEMMVIVEE